MLASTDLIIKEIKDYKSIYNLAKRYRAEPTSIPKVVKAWKVKDGNEMVGGVVLLKVKGFCFLEWLAVIEKYRRKGIGAMLVEEIINYCNKNNINQLYLCAKVPDYFKRFGFINTGMDKIPKEFSCFDCNKYQKGCYPEAMVLML